MASIQGMGLGIQTSYLNFIKYLQPSLYLLLLLPSVYFWMFRGKKREEKNLKFKELLCVLRGRSWGSWFLCQASPVLKATSSDWVVAGSTWNKESELASRPAGGKERGGRGPIHTGKTKLPWGVAGERTVHEKHLAQYTVYSRHSVNVNVWIISLYSW